MFNITEILRLKRGIHKPYGYSRGENKEFTERIKADAD